MASGRRICVVGISGGSASGKSDLAGFLKRKLGDRAVLLCQDWYYRDNGHLTGGDHHGVNFDHPRAFENGLLLRHLDRLLKGSAVDTPRYEYATHKRLEKTVRIEPARVIVVEGLFVLHDRSLRERLDFAVYIDVPDDVRLLRRVRRDCKERHIELEETLRLYESYVRPMHGRFIEPSAKKATAVWRQLEDKTFPDRLLRRIRKLIG